MITIDHAALVATIALGVFIFGVMLFNPGTSHKPTTTIDQSGAVVTKKINWEMMNVNR